MGVGVSRSLERPSASPSTNSESSSSKISTGSAIRTVISLRRVTAVAGRIIFLIALWSGSRNQCSGKLSVGLGETG